jgi:hypothetical protein
MVDAYLEVVVVLRYERTAPSLRAVVLHQDGSVDLLGTVDLLGHVDAGRSEPQSLLFPVRFPFQHLPVPEGRQFKFEKLLCAQVLDKGAVRYDDRILLGQFLCRAEDVLVFLYDEEFVGLGKWKCIIEHGLLAHGNSQGPESLFPRAMKDLEARVGTYSGDGQVVSVRSEKLCYSFL